MQRFPRTATNIIVALTALAWIIAAALGQSDAAAFSFGFIPLRVAVPAVPYPAAPVFLTPRGLDHVGPRAFGYDLDFNSVFQS